MNTHIPIAAAALISATICSAQHIQDQIDLIRTDVIESTNHTKLGSGYAAMINFAVNPDIAAAHYYIDDDTLTDSTIRTFRLPLKHIFNADNTTWRPFIQANFARQNLSYCFPTINAEKIDTEWEALGTSLAIGTELLYGEHWKIMPVINSGLARLTNAANYTGELSNTLIKPALQGIIYDWETDVWLLGGSLATEYVRSFQSFDFNASASLSHNYMETYDADNELIAFQSHASSLSAHAETIYPTGLQLGNLPLALVTNIGATTFLGTNSDALGFDYFFEGGLAIEATLNKHNWHIKKLRIGAKAIYGEDVTGWSAIFGYRIQ